jgi:hypothetical protein
MLTGVHDTDIAREIGARVASMRAIVTRRDPEHVYIRRDTGAQLLGTTTLLGTAGFINTKGHEPQHAERGRFIHEATQLIDDDDLVDASVPAAWVGYCDSYKRWRDEFAPQWWLSEQIVCDLSLGYAGALDRLGVINGSTLALVDFKAGARARWHGLQLAGYKRPIAGDDYRLRRELERFTLYLKADGSRASLYPWTDRRDEQFFLAALTCCRFKEIA